MNLAPGTRLGHYEIVARIGQGGMGEVYKGTDTRLGRSVAIKVVARDLSANPRYRKRLEYEAKTISRLQHANVCTLHDIGDENDTQFLVMEYLEGPTLADRLRSGPMTPREVLQVGVAIAGAVDAAHQLGVVHRDLKPGNVMLSPAGTKVLDFGLAKPVQSSASNDTTVSSWFTDDGAIAGTLPYMAPEQLEGKEPDPRSDIWAIGCILYEAATGSRPFQGENNAALVHSIMSAEPPLLARLPSIVAPRFSRVVRRCLQRAPQDRYASAKELLAELRGSLATGEELHGSVDALSETQTLVVERTGSRSLRRKLVVGALVLLTMAFGYFQLRPDPTPPIAVDGAAVAVLPFENLTGDDQLGFIGSGLAAGLISQLAQRPGLNVVGRSRAWRANEKTENTAKMAELLGVSYFVEGQVQSFGGNVQTDVSIVDGMNERVLWSDQFTGTRDELYQLQMEIVHEVARVLSVPLSREERRRLTRSAPSSQAFNYYLQGIERLEQRGNPRHLEYAADLFRQAIRIEGEVAAFHAALSNAISQRYLNQESYTPAEATEAEEEARKALALQPELAQGNVALAQALRMQGRHAESIAELRPVLANHPKPDEAFLELSFGYEFTGDDEAALQALESAVALGPDNWFNWNALGVTQVERGEIAEGMASLLKAVALAPAGVVWPRMNLGAAKLALGDFAGAIEEFEATGATTSNPDLTGNIATAYFFLGQLDQAESMYRRAVELDPEDHILHRNLGDALLERRKDAAAMEEYSAALRFVEQQLANTPKNGTALLARALYSGKLGRCDQALEHLNQAAPYVEAGWIPELDKAMTYSLCKRYADAVQGIERALDLGAPKDHIRAQPEFRALEDHPEYNALVAARD